MTIKKILASYVLEIRQKLPMCMYAYIFVRTLQNCFLSIYFKHSF